MVSHTFTSCLDGFFSQLVQIETSQQNSLPQIVITGLPSTVVQESRERIKSSLHQLGFKLPKKKTLVHLSPAETKKSGSHFDLPIAMSLLSLEGHLPVQEIKHRAFFGELSPSGKIHPVKHLIPLLEKIIGEENISEIIVPNENYMEASVFSSSKIVFCGHLTEVISLCCARSNRVRAEIPLMPVTSAIEDKGPALETLLGQETAKKTLVLSLAGNLPLLIEGPPGSGKTHLASCAPTLLPNLTLSEQIEVSKIFSLVGENRVGNLRPPFRSPHHSVSAAAFLGGGQGIVYPGELTLAHRGLLFLDELPEFRRDALEGLREPIQNGEIHLSRISSTIRLPASFRLIAALNPCPCGYFQSKNLRCSCSENQIRHYRKKISGPLLDRFSLYLWMESEGHQDFARERSFSSSQIRHEIKRVQEALPSFSKQRISPDASQWLMKNSYLQKVSFRRKQNFERAAFTLALLEGEESVRPRHLEEAWILKSPESLLHSF